MPTEEIFDTLMRSTGDRAGVFECDDGTAYFYLYDTERDEAVKVFAAIHVLTGAPDFGADDVSIRWDSTESKVALLIRGRVWAMFDLNSDRSYGGDYGANRTPLIPEEILSAFGAS